jgi:hypothetical protein
LTRVTAVERVRHSSVAEREIQRFAKPDPRTGLKPHALWHKHVHNVELDPMQVLKMLEMDRHRNTVDYSCRRTGKTAVKELYNLERLATDAHQECGIVAPRMQQSQNNLDYMLEAIRRSPMLSAYIAYKQGRPQLKDTGFEFANHSKAGAYGIMSQIDGDSISIASLEETDDMPQDRLMSRFLPMLGAARRLGADMSRTRYVPEVRITGVFKGAGVLERLMASGAYHVLPTVDVYLGRQLGLLADVWVDDQRMQQSSDEWIRQFLCRNIAARNWIWEEHIRRAIAVGLEAGIERAEPLPGMRYKRRGILSFGYDHTGHGEQPQASRSALVVCETLGNWVTVPFVKLWAPGVSDAALRQDLVSLWDYFRPDYAIGDAYGVGMLTAVNDDLFSRGLTEVNREAVNDGQSNATGWAGWAFAPMRFEGMVKHVMASAVREIFHHGRAALPYIDTGWDGEDRDWLALPRQLGNMKALPTRASYSSFQMADHKIGDDLFDALCAGVYALLTRGLADTPAVVQGRRQSREALLASNAPGLLGGRAGLPGGGWPMPA